VTDGTHESVEPRRTPLLRLRALFGLAPDPRLRGPEVQRLRPIRRGWAGAAWQARAAVEAGVSLSDYLRARLARYETLLPVPRARLPLQIELAGCELRSSLLPASPGAPSDPAAAAAALEALDGPSAVREWTQVHARIVGLEEAAAGARRRVEELSDRLSADVARGAIATERDEETPPEALGRPVVRGADGLAALIAIAVAAVLAQAWAIAVPLLFRAGVYPPALTGPHALQSGLLLAFSLGASVGLLALAFVALEAAERLVRGATPRNRRRLVTAAAVFGLVAAVIAVEAATLSSPRSGIPPASHAFLLLATPAGAAMALRRAKREHEAREQQRAAALAWDRERAIALGARARRLEELAWAVSAANAARKRLERARRRARELARRADAAARLLAAAARKERREQLRVAQSLLAALERDRYEYLRCAGARRAADAAEASRVTPATARAGAERGVGSGRVAV
jgi:hypothetical protein